MDKGGMEESSDRNNHPGIRIAKLNRVKNIRHLRNADPRDCSVCLRNFASGKALGGHMRVHSFPVSPAADEVGFGSNQLLPKETNMVRLVIKDSSKEIDAVAPLDVDAGNSERWSEICLICGKMFFSLKSLFEHNTRCHPEEEAVGLGSGNGPPPHNLIASLPGNWSVKAKRGERNSLIRVYDRDVKVAALTLMSMYKLEIRNHEQLKMIQSMNRNSSSPAQGLNDFQVQGKWPKGRQSFKGKASSKIGSSPSPEALFKCVMCDRAFTSYQALGGHRSSHNKPKNIQAIGGAGSKTTRNRETGIPHQCKVCRKVFLSGQALGGHKRYCHWVNHLDIPDSNWELGSPLKKMKSPVLEFDMNHEPAEMENQEEIRMGMMETIQQVLLR